MAEKDKIRQFIRKVLAEISDYQKKDIDDMEDLYHGNLYIKSSNPLTLEEIRKKEYVTADIEHRADASDVTSEYIYRIKTKYPLYKREYHWDPLNQSAPTEKNSGYFSYHNTFQENYARVKTSDIIDFKLVGGFAMFDKNVPDKRNISISNQTERFLSSYIGGDIMHKRPTPEVVSELEHFKPDSPIKIYKGIEEVQILHNSTIKPPYNLGQIIVANFPHLTSWTRNPLIGRRFIDEYPSSTPFLVEMTIDPKDILVDVQMLPEMYYHANQREIIVKPGTYSFKIVWQGK